MSKLNLIVGCGGSGLTTLTALNRLLAQNPEVLPRLGTDFYYIAVDTDTKDLDAFKTKIEEQVGSWEPPFIQKVQLSENVNVLNEVIRPNFVRPFTGKTGDPKGLERLRGHWWFDSDGNPFNAPQIRGKLSDGAGQCPPASYGLAWYKLDKIGQAVKNVVDRMVECGYGNETDLKEMNLVIVAGLSGGTGRGCWNLIMFKIREYLLDNYKVMVPPIGIFFDSSVYDSVADDNEGQRTPLKVNALTGLSELSCWIQNGAAVGDRRVDYRVPSLKTPARPETDILQVDLEFNPNSGTPVSNAYLICGRNGGNSILGDNIQYHEMAGAGLYSMIVNPQIQSRQINDGDPVNSFGAATFEVDTLHIRSYFETRARRMALDELASAGESATVEVDQFLQDNPVILRAQSLEDLRPKSDGTLFQRAVSALFSGRIYQANFSSMENGFEGWDLATANANVSKVLKPASEAVLNEAVKTALHSYAMVDAEGQEKGGLEDGKLTEAVVRYVDRVFNGGNGPSVARVKSFLETLKKRISKVGVDVGALSKMEVTGVTKNDFPDKVLEKTLEVKARRSVGEKVAVWKHIGPFNSSERKELISKDGPNEYWGIIPKGVVAVNVAGLVKAFAKAFQGTVDKIDGLIKACEQFQDCCREVAETFAQEEGESAGGKSGENAFARLFATPARIEATLYEDTERERFYHRVLRPIFRDQKDMEETVRTSETGGMVVRSYRIGDELSAFISDAVKDGLLESLAPSSGDKSGRTRQKARKEFVEKLTETARMSVRLSDSFMETHFSFERVLERNRDFWNEAIARTIGDAAQFNRLKTLFKRTLGAEPQIDPKHRNDPPVLPETDELLKTIGTSLVSTCAPWWDADTEGAHHSILLFVPFDLASKKEDVKKFISSRAPHVPKVTPYGMSDVNSGVTPFSYVAFSAAGVKLTSDESNANKVFEGEPEKQTFLFDKITSLANDWTDSDVSTWLRMAEDPAGASIFSTENGNKGIGYVSPVYVRDKKLSSYRWKPWVRDDAAAAASAESKALDVLLYAMLGMGLTETQVKAFEEKFAPYGWSLPPLRYAEKGQVWSLARKTLVWDNDEGRAMANTDCGWKAPFRLCTSVCNLFAMLKGAGKTGKAGERRQSDIEEGNQLRALLETESKAFEDNVRAELGADMKKLIKARTGWLTNQRDNATDKEDEEVFNLLLQRIKGK